MFLHIHVRLLCHCHCLSCGSAASARQRETRRNRNRISLAGAHRREMFDTARIPAPTRDPAFSSGSAVPAMPKEGRRFAGATRLRRLPRRLHRLQHLRWHIPRIPMFQCPRTTRVAKTVRPASSVLTPHPTTKETTAEFLARTRGCRGGADRSSSGRRSKAARDRERENYTAESSALAGMPCGASHPFGDDGSRGGIGAGRRSPLRVGIVGVIVCK